MWLKRCNSAFTVKVFSPDAARLYFNRQLPDNDNIHSFRYGFSTLHVYHESFRHSLLALTGQFLVTIGSGCSD